MTLDFFSGQMIRLSLIYGEKYYPQERQRLIWDATRDVSENRFEAAISNLISDSKFAPMKSEILEAISAVKVTASAPGEFPTNTGIRCQYCAGYGTMSAEKIENNYPYSYTFRCSFCTSPEELGITKNYPLFGVEYINSGFIAKKHP